MIYKKLKKLVPSELCLYYNTAWIGHGTFAMWAATTFKPKVIVELGSHGGYSYFAFCEAVKKYKLDCKCYAIDSWEGDDHASFYDNSIYDHVKNINELNYTDFSVLIRKYFDQAVNDFDDKSIDILHIDGRHGFDDVKYDFECYEKKLSDNAIVIFHDINCFKPGFGVYKFYAELSKKYTHTEFEHSSGLGIIFYGKNFNEESNPFAKTVKELCNKKSELYQALYYTGLNNMSRYKLARMMNKKSHKSYNNKLRILRHRLKIYIKDFLFKLKIAVM